MLIVAKITKRTAGGYAEYLEGKARASELGDYYLKDGERVEAPGRWVGGAHLFGLDATVPVTGEQLSALRAFEVVVRMPGRDGRPTVAGGILLPPGVADPAVAAATIAASDAQDARPLDEVRAEVDRRAGGTAASDAAGTPPPGPKGALQR